MTKEFVLVAGEASGDILGASLIKSLKLHYPDARFSGIGGKLMMAEGFQSIFPMERLSIMGIVPILKRLPELLIMRRKLARHIIDLKPSCFIGIDAPVFNTGLEFKLKSAQIKTVHYVSPSVWAWRENRIYKIAKSVSLMLCLFPFELPIYKKHAVPAVCIGHPLANEIPMDPDVTDARAHFGFNLTDKVVALLPGSRGSELNYLLEPFIQTASVLNSHYLDIRFVVPCANQKRRQQVEAFLNNFEHQLPITLVDGQSRLVMQAADAVLLASGTATLEAMLLKKPMLVAYKMSNFSVWVFKKLLKIKQFSLPNLLAGKDIVKEFIQEDCVPEKLSRELIALIDSNQSSPVISQYYELHQSLKLGGSHKAAEAIVELIKENKE